MLCEPVVINRATTSALLVLILVLMEDALREEVMNLFEKAMNCLNPCSNGRCSASLLVDNRLKLETVTS